MFVLGHVLTVYFATPPERDFTQVGLFVYDDDGALVWDDDGVQVYSD